MKNYRWLWLSLRALVLGVVTLTLAWKSTLAGGNGGTTLGGTMSNATQLAAQFNLDLNAEYFPVYDKTDQGETYSGCMKFKNGHYQRYPNISKTECEKYGRDAENHRAPNSPTNSGSGGCFVRGTLVDTPDGRRPIEDLKPGDRIYSFDHASRKIVVGAINKARRLGGVRYGVLSFGTAGLRIGVTPEHPFYFADKNDYLPIGAADLKKSTFAVFLKSLETHNTENGKIGEFASDSISFSMSDGRTDVYVLEIEGYHNYFVHGILVHNDGPRGKTA